MDAVETIVTDSRWTTSTGPIMFDSIYGGETYDARAEKPGWDTPDYDDSGVGHGARWLPPPGGKLAAQMMPPIKADRVIKPVKLTEPKPGVFVFDMGQNIAGFAELTRARASGREGGDEIRRAPGQGRHARPGRHRSSTSCKVDTNQQYQTDTYILKGTARGSRSASRFTYHGFQYVEVTGFPGKPTLDTPARRLHPLGDAGGGRVRMLESAAEPRSGRRAAGLT